MYCAVVVVDPEAPAFLQAAGHPLRWRLLLHLARGDRPVRELTGLVGQPQNLVSYHLGRLRQAGLINGRRSAADGRDTYYTLDLRRCGELLTGAGGSLHPALKLRRPSDPGPVPARVLFLCTGNSSRSQMAEAILRHRAAPAVEAFSAGSHPKPVHPAAIAVMHDIGIDLSAARSRHLSEYARERFDYVVTLCDRVREVCPEFPGHPEAIHWSMPDPSGEPDGDPAFVRARSEIAERVDFLLHLIAADAGRDDDG
jgi:protein-tyrosine-phosphatase/DNA-binding transcriptional ArsR family regulator